MPLWSACPQFILKAAEPFQKQRGESMAGRNDDHIRCSFCNKSQAQVRKLIAGPNGVYICDACVDVCAEIIEEEFEYENN